MGKQVAVEGTVTANANLQAGTNNAGNVGGITMVVTTVLTRAANATPYSAGDEIVDVAGTIKLVTGAATKSGGSGFIMGLGMACSSGTPATGLEIWVFDTTSTPQTDNTAFAPADGEVATALAVFSLPTSFQGTTGSTGNVWYDSGPLSRPFLTVGSANLYFRVVTRAAYTPGASSDTYTFRWFLSQDL